MKTKHRRNLKNLISSNPRVDRDLLMEALTAIKALRKSGIGQKGYDLNDHRMCSPLKRQDSVRKFPLLPSSVITSKPANDDQVKTGQRTRSGTKLFYLAEGPFGKPVLVRQLFGPHFNTCPW